MIIAQCPAPQPTPHTSIPAYDMAIPSISGPVPISKVQGRYFVHSAAHASHLRQAHNITGVLAGNLPQAPQQNVFLGLPLQLMPEEARLLVEKGAAYIVDDATAHKSAFLEDGLSEEEKQQFRHVLEKQGLDASRAQVKRSEDRKETALQKIAEREKARQGANEDGSVGDGDMNNWNDLPEGMLAPRSRASGSRTKSRRRGGERSASSSVGPQTRDDGTGPPSSGAQTPADPALRPPGPPRSISRDDGRPAGPPRSISRDDGPPRSRSRGFDQGKDSTDDTESLFDSQAPQQRKKPDSLKSASTLQPHSITPATSYPPLTAHDDPSNGLPEVPESYAVYKHLHNKGYFLAPGLRFGCQYMAYPGDPLRYHSHFLVNGKQWDEDFDLMELVAGGRLGTGVKKGFLLGGKQGSGSSRAEVDAIQNGVRKISLSNGETGGQEEDNVRAFTVEWAGM